MAVAVLALLWLTVMYFRWEIRATWWAWQVRRAPTAASRDYYTACLASIGSRALVAVTALATDERSEVREAALRVLRRCRDPRADRLLVNMLTDPDDDLVAMAAIELALRDRPGTLRLLTDGLTAAPRAGGENAGHERRRRRAAMVALARLGGDEAREALLQVLETADDPDLVAQAIDSLGMLECRQAVPQIARFLDDARPLTTRPASWNSAARAVAVLQRDLTVRGLAPQALLEALGSPMTVSAVAERTLRLLQTPAPSTSAASAAVPLNPPSASADSPMATAPAP